MTVSSAVTRNDYIATGGQTIFPYTFETFASSDLVVLQNGSILSEGSQYTVSGVGLDAGGDITLLSGATVSDAVSVYLNMDLARSTDYQNSGDFLASEVNDDFDRMWLANKQQQNTLDRSLHLPDEDSTRDMTLPALASIKGTVLAFDETTGLPVVGPDIADVSSIASITADIARLADIEDGTLATDAIQDTAAISANVTTVANISTDVSTVSSNTANINTVAANDTDITTVAGIRPDILLLSPISADITASAAIAADITTAATNVADITNFADVYIGASATDPTVRNDASALQAGDLYFNTTVNFMQAYDGTGWTSTTGNQQAVSVKDYGATGDNSTDDTAAIQAALDTGRAVFIPIGDYKVSSTLYLTAKGQSVYGESRTESIIKRTDHLGPVLELKYARITVDNFTVKHTSLPDKATIETARGISNVGQGALIYFPETSGVANAGKGFMTIRNMVLLNGYTAIENDWAATESGVFSAAFENIYSRQITGSFVLLNPGGSGNSGCIWNNCYFANSRGDGILMNRAFDYREGSNSSFNQLNIEACNVEANEIMYLQNIDGCVFDSIHFEDVTLAPNSASSGACITMSTSTSATFNGVHFNKLGVNAGTGAGQANNFAIFKLSGNGTTQPSFVATETTITNVDPDVAGVNDNLSFVDGLNPTSFYLVNMDDTDLLLSEGVSVSLNGVRSELNIVKSVYTTDAELENFGISNLEFSYFDGTSSATKVESFTTLSNIGNFIRLVTQPDVTISAGAVTATGANLHVDTEAAAATDDLDTINGGEDGDILIVTAASGSRDVVLKDTGGNLKLAGDFTLTSINDKIILIKNPSGNWCELSRSDNNV